MNDNFSLGERLRGLRLERGLSQEQVANIANVTTTHLGQVERGTKNVTVITLEKICKALNISLFEFFSTEKSCYKEDIDETSNKILHQLIGKSEVEKQIILHLIKLVFSIQKLKS